MFPSDSSESHARRIDTGQAKSKAAPKRVYLKSFDVAPCQMLTSYGAPNDVWEAVSSSVSSSSFSSSDGLASQDRIAVSGAKGESIVSDGAPPQDRIVAVSGAKDESIVSSSPKVSASIASTSPPEVVSEASAVSRAP